MNKKIIIMMGVLVVALSGFYYSHARAQNSGAVLKTDSLKITSADGKSHQFNIELAITPDEQAYGLMNRESMPQDAGMLFVFGQEREIAFYMKDTLIPLDMIFIKKDGKISYIYENATPLDETSILSNGPVYAVLEINGGVSSKLGIKVGDVVDSAFFGD